MARRSKKKPKLADLPALDDPRAPIDGATFLAAAQPVLKALDKDLLARAKGSPAVDAALRARHAEEKKEERTAASFNQWRERFVGQVGAAWLLSCVFVRVLEDRGLTRQNRIAGPGAADAQRLFFEMAPSLTERDYLLTVFRELTHYAAAEALFDARHNPVWLLAPSAEAAKQLLALFRTPNADAPAFRFGQESTRFLGDLYQDLDEGVRKRFALLQTPDFVEKFILDRTLEPAIEHFGLQDTDLIDPTCGSGHFLLGAFDRLFEHRLRAEPGIDRRQAALAALDKVAGADINPYAAAIARFRLTLSFLDKAGYDKIADAPKLPLHVAVADSLLYNPQLEQLEFASVAEGFERRAYELEDAAEAKDVLHREYAAVVGNPPYITVKDKTLRDRYRALYPSAHRQYSLAVPFVERFFQLARKDGRVGQITANSFMKREFGSKLIEDYLPTVDLDLIVNTSGAYIPGHGTPTVLLFGAHRGPSESTVLSVLGKRGEPSTPADPAKGLVWSSILEHWGEVDHDDDYISVSRIERDVLGKHPWTLAGGGAMELKAFLEERAHKRLGELTVSMGRVAHTGNDEPYVADSATLRRFGLDEAMQAAFVEGEVLRDWGMSQPVAALFPYDDELEAMREDLSDPRLRRLWPYRAMLWERREPNGTHREIGKTWYEYSRFHPERFVGMGIAFAFVATHNHFVLDRGGKVFNRTAPIIKLPETATEEDHLGLLAYLNSSTACFWMKQVCHNKTNASQKHTTDPARAAYEFAGTALEGLPVPSLFPRVVSLARTLTEQATVRSTWLSGEPFKAWLTSGEDAPLQEVLEASWKEYEYATARCVYLQEQIDWTYYQAFGLCQLDERDLADHGLAIGLGERPFESASGYDAGVSERASRGGVPQQAFDDVPEDWAARKGLLANSRTLALLESRSFKRMWRDTEQNVDPASFRAGLPPRWTAEVLAHAAEAVFDDRSMSVSECLSSLQPTLVERCAQVLGSAGAVALAEQLDGNAVPFLSALTFTPSGLAKLGAWEETWRLQRDEDRGHAEREIPKPPAFSQGSRGKSRDFASQTYYGLRGKLNVPKERFISYPGCESDHDGEPVYGWAGWDHEQRAKALAILYHDRKTKEGWDKDRLTPMLAGLLELQFWLELWHDEPNDDYGGTSPATYYRGFREAECNTFGLTPEDLRAWRPPEKKKRGRKK